MRRLRATAIALVVLGAGLIVGLNAGAASAGHAMKTTGNTPTVPEPSVTTVTRPTVPASELPGTGKPIVHLGDGNTPDEFIIGQLYEVALQNRGYTVVLDRNASVYSQQFAGLQNGRLDLYPEYLGAWNSWIAGLHRRFASLRASYRAGAAYASKHGLVLLPPTPYSYTSCVAVLAQYAAANHVYSIPELASEGPIVFGAPITFLYQSDGISALEHGYHLHPGYVQTILDTLQYWWLTSGNVQAAYCKTTDPLLASPKFVELQDPKHVFGYGNVVPVTTRRVLRAEGPDFLHTIERVDSLLTLRAIRGLNAEYELGDHLPTPIAEQFLEGNGIVPRSRYAPVQTTTSANGSTSPTT